MNQISQLTHREGGRAGVLAFAALFATIFSVFFIVAVVAQLMMLNWRSWFPGAEDSKSLTGGVRAAVYTLMSQIN
ncbi:MAG: hypothetical protein RI968_58 [Pseudomonadota bacterium]|jgi:light-harvesting complex 1 beta chain